MKAITMNKPRRGMTKKTKDYIFVALMLSAALSARQSAF